MAAVIEWLRLNWMLLTFIGGLVLVFALFRTSPTPGMDSLQALDSRLANGQPAVVEFYSNF